MTRPLLSLLLLAASVLAHGDERPIPRQSLQFIPDVVPSVRSGVRWPVWVSATAAFDAKGELRSDLFSEVDRTIIDANRRANASSCRQFTGRVDETFRPQDSVDDLVENALTIVAGRVVETAQGFYAGQPGTLAAVRVSSRLKTAGRAADGEILHLFMPEARISTPRGLVCASSFSDVPSPAVGDGLIAFAYFDAMDQDRSILTVDPRKQLILDEGGQLHAPPALRGLSQGKTLDDVAASIRRHPRIHVVPQHEVR